MAENNKAEQREGRWSAVVTATSHALDLPAGLFKRPTAAAIAAGLLEAAERSTTRKRSAYASAMAMLCFYINRAGSNLPAGERQRLEAAKVELRRLTGRDTSTELSRPAR